MIILKGKYTQATVYTDKVEASAVDQIQELCNQKFAENSKIKIMPDVHAGMGCVVGFTAQLGELVIPSIVGVDIGCGMLTIELGKRRINFKKLDKVIRDFVPSGQTVHKQTVQKYERLTDLHCYQSLDNIDRFHKSVGTLGGGNHFIEVAQDQDQFKYLVIHTGSRSLGTYVAHHYQNLAQEDCSGKDEHSKACQEIIAQYKKDGKTNEIQTAIKNLEKEFLTNKSKLPKYLCYLSGAHRQLYLDDMKICQDFATLNRQTIANLILENAFDLGLDEFESFETVHNYIDLESNIVRKGAVSAKKGERILIPINMKDGSLICVGKGNEEWNNSAPHGAGRLFSRSKAESKFTLKQFQKAMEGVYTTSIHKSTIDECPMAYKGLKDITDNITPTVDIEKQIKSIYNFKAN